MAVRKATKTTTAKRVEPKGYLIVGYTYACKNVYAPEEHAPYETEIYKTIDEAAEAAADLRADVGCDTVLIAEIIGKFAVTTAQLVEF